MSYTREKVLEFPGVTKKSKTVSALQEPCLVRKTDVETNNDKATIEVCTGCCFGSTDKKHLT